MKDGIVYIGNFKTIDLDNWSAVSTKGIRQARARQVHRAKITYPRCNIILVVPLQFFTIKMNGTIESDRPLTCALDSSKHGYSGGCGHMFVVLKDRPLGKRRRK